MSARARKSTFLQDQIRDILFTESGDESDVDDDNDCDEFIVSENDYSSTSDDDASLHADTSVLGKLIENL